MQINIDLVGVGNARIIKRKHACGNNQLNVFQRALPPRELDNVNEKWACHNYTDRLKPV
jgi:hypothetical protein